MGERKDAFKVTISHDGYVTQEHQIASGVSGGGATGLPPVQVLVVPENTYVDLSRRPDIQSLEPLKDHRIKAISAAPRTPTRRSAKR